MVNATEIGNSSTRKKKNDQAPNSFLKSLVKPTISRHKGLSRGNKPKMQVSEGEAQIIYSSSPPVPPAQARLSLRPAHMPLPSGSVQPKMGPRPGVGAFSHCGSDPHGPHGSDPKGLHGPRGALTKRPRGNRSG